MKVTKDTVIGTILDTAPQTAPYFLEMGMHCLGCPASRGESIADACAVHDVDADELVEKLLGEYDVPVEVAKRDVSAFLGKLREAGLLE